MANFVCNETIFQENWEDEDEEKEQKSEELQSAVAPIKKKPIAERIAEKEVRMRLIHLVRYVISIRLNFACRD